MHPDVKISRWQSVLWWGLPAFITLVLAAVRWQRFGDVQVDFGQDIAAAWSLTEGKHLYSDIAYFKGPFSPYVNAMLLTVFGTSLRTMMLANGVIALGIAYGIQILARGLTERHIAGFLSCAFLLVFAFSVDKELNIYNFITPFVHELTHGLGLSLLTLLSLERWTRAPKGGTSMIAGFAFGLAWLTRIEIVVALTAACMTWGWCLVMQGYSRKHLMRGSLVFLCAAMSILLFAVLALRQTMSWNAALHSVFASFEAAMRTPIATSPFFRMLSGWDHPFAMIGMQIVIILTIGAWMLFLYGAVDLWKAKSKDMSICLGIAGFTFILMLANRILPFIHGGFLTVSTIALIIAVTRHIMRARKTASVASRCTLVLSVFALVMLGKIFLAPSIRFYGFAHGMPAYLLFLGVLLTVAPKLAARRLGTDGARLFAILLTLAIIIDVGAKARIDQHLIHGKTIPIGSGGDRFFVADVRSNGYFRDFLAEAPSLIPAGSSLSAIPEGAMINYLLKLPLGTPILNYMRTEYTIFGKDRIEGDLFAHRPDFILVTHKETSDFGYPLFGKMPEYGAEVMAWIHRDYEQIALFGEQPLTKKDSEGVALWRRKDVVAISSQ